MERVFEDYLDQPTATYGAQYGDDLCGSKTIEIYMYDKETLLISQITGDQTFTETVYFTENINAWLTYSVIDTEHKLTVKTDDPALVNNEWQTFFIRVQLDDYYLDNPDTIHYDSFRVKLKNCQVADFTPATDSQLTFGVNS